MGRMRLRRERRGGFRCVRRLSRLTSHDADNATLHWLVIPAKAGIQFLAFDVRATEKAMDPGLRRDDEVGAALAGVPRETRHNPRRLLRADPPRPHARLAPPRRYAEPDPVRADRDRAVPARARRPSPTTCGESPRASCSSRCCWRACSRSIRCSAATPKTARSNNSCCRRIRWRCCWRARSRCTG